MYRRLVNELHLYRRAALGAGGHPAGLDRASTATIVDKIAARQAAAAGRALHEHVMAAASACIAHAAMAPRVRATIEEAASR